MKVNQPAESNGAATNPPSVDERTVVELCDAYLATLHTGAWGRMFYITDSEGRRAAAQFLADNIEGVMNHAKQR